MTAGEKLLVEATLAAKDQTIIVLTDVVDHLRHLLAQRPDPVAVQLPGPATERIDSDEPPQRMHTSEDEEDILFMHAAGNLTDEQRDAALQRAGVMPLTLVQ